MSDFMQSGIYGGDTDKGFGAGGINGVHHNVVGWDNTTVGAGSVVFNRILAQNGVQNYDPNVIPALEPIRAGRFLVKWLKYPPFFDPIAVQYMKFFLEDCVRQVDGVPDNTMSTIDGPAMGMIQQEMSFPGTYKESGKEVTLTTFTCSGDGLGKLMRYWKYGLSDPATGFSTMYGKNLRFVRPNYAGSLLYVFLGPTARPGDIEFSCLWHECFPTSADGNGIFNSGVIGDVGNISERTETFSGIYQTGPEVNILAKYIVAGYGLYGQSYLDRALPAYMYEYYINPISTGDADTLADISITQDSKLNSVSDTYTSDIQNIRNEVRDKMGLNSDNNPSKILTVEDTIDTLNNYNTDSFVSGN